MLKLSSVTAASAQPPMMGINDKYTPVGNDSPKRRLETNTLKAGSPLLIMCVNETATFDMLTVAATCPIVCATATYKHQKFLKTTKLKNCGQKYITKTNKGSYTTNKKKLNKFILRKMI